MATKFGDDWVGTTKAAEMLQVSKATIHVWTKKYGAEFSVKVGSRNRIKKSAIYQILQGNMPPLRETSANAGEQGSATSDTRQEKLFKE